MKNETKYEWCAEEVNKDGDIQELWFCDTLEDALKTAKWLENDSDIVLLMYIGNEIDGELFRYYAYLVDGKLPKLFGDTDIKVPFKFHKEVKQANL